MQKIKGIGDSDKEVEIRLNDERKRELTEGQINAWARQVLVLDSEIPENQIYWDEFVKFKFPTDKQYMSMAQYKSRIFGFIRFIKKDLCLVTWKDINDFAELDKNKTTARNKKAYIKSILTFIVQKNIANCLDRISKETLILIIQL